MSPLKPAFAESRLPPMQLRRGSVGPSVAPHLHASYLMRGLFLVGALALPALGIQLADRPAQTPNVQAIQVAAVHPTPPLRTAAVLIDPALR